MNSILKMQNMIQDYAWGSRTAIAQLMGKPFPTKTPEAELWLGAHPKAPSRVWVDDGWQNLDRWIAQSPETILGPEVCTRFKGTLPYLFKILAATQPLSIQSHPNKEQARLGFERENINKIPIGAAHRNYKDPHHKPECICALTPFWALCGFRDRDEICANLEDVWPDNYSADLAILKNSGVKAFFKNLMNLDNKACMDLVQRVIEKVSVQSDPNAMMHWMLRLQAQYPGDPGVISPAFLNLIHLQPGEALSLESGQLHAYLDGLGIELMANSDNVLRGGLTPKHVDVPELLRVTLFDSYSPEIIKPSHAINNEKFYASLAEEFMLSAIETTAQRNYFTQNRLKAPEILLCTNGRAQVVWQNGLGTVALEQGRSVFVPATVDQYTIEGESIVYKAGLNIEINHP